jgi:hypothetical protein
MIFPTLGTPNDFDYTLNSWKIHGKFIYATVLLPVPSESALATTTGRPLEHPWKHHCSMVRGAAGSHRKCTGHNYWKTTGRPLETPLFCGEGGCWFPQKVHWPQLMEDHWKTLGNTTILW